jgi:hypothetical protein
LLGDSFGGLCTPSRGRTRLDLGHADGHSNVQQQTGTPGTCSVWPWSHR